MSLFYRKESPAIFAQRFSKPAPPSNAWSLKSNLVFDSKQKAKIVTVKSKRISCSVMGSAIQLSGFGKPKIIFEKDIAAFLAEKSDDVVYLALKQICKDHATSSRSSILISGCVEDNFSASTTYPGHKLCVKLKTRTPFANPFVSGLEKENFLVGSLSDTECDLIKYFGETKEELNEVVNFFGSGIARPKS